jgi:CheY-like chemotaxis protein
LRVLLAEDNPVNRIVALGMLERLGMQADAVANGAEAVVAVATIPYDLVLMDVQMPVMDGFEATAAIRERERGGSRRIPIIAMTAHAMQGDRDRCLAAGMDDYVPKPVHRPRLEEVLLRWAPRPAADSATRLGEAAAPAAAGERMDLAVASPIRAPVAADEPDPPDLDVVRLEAVVDHDPELERELIDLYLAETQRHLARIRAAIAAHEAPPAERHARALKSESRTIGALALGGMAEELERLAKTADFAAAQAALERTEAAFERVAETMTQRRLRTAA